MSIEQTKLKNIIEAAMLAIAHPMSLEQLAKLFDDDDRPSANAIKEIIQQLQAECDGRGVELKEVASGYRYQARQEFSEWLSRLWEERPAKYSRAALETLALITYRQPVTRAEIEDVRGVGVSSSIIKTLMEREWIRIVGHRDVPGRPALYATTKQFLDYFNMKSLEELPSLAEIKDLADLNPELDLPNPDDEREAAASAQNADDSDKHDDDGQDQIKQLSAPNDDKASSEDEQQVIDVPAGALKEGLAETDSDLESESDVEWESDADHQGEHLEPQVDMHSESNHDRFYALPEEQTDSEHEQTPANTKFAD